MTIQEDKHIHSRSPT